MAMINASSSKKYHVFISFRGEDTRIKFTSHFYEAMNKEAITFRDDKELEKGDEISPSLIKAIEESYSSVVIFSKNYASSKWCLNELIKILECKKVHGQIVIPIFYEIDPSDVRKQTGSYKEAFETYERDLNYNRDQLQKWKEALTEAANLSGWHFQNDRIESDFIKEIVEDILKQLKQLIHRHSVKVNNKLVGIEKKCKEVESLMKFGSNDVRRIVLWGMGGIGKSTLATELYVKHYPQFDHWCFLKNVRDESTSYIPNVLQNKHFPTLLERCLDAPHEETIFISKLAREKVFIVLDDVPTSELPGKLDIINNCLGPGSRVILTTRDKQICSQFDECQIYEVNRLNNDDSLQLFCNYAFREKHAKVGYEKLSESAIDYCGGNPLALKVLGAHFCTRSKEAWESELEKLKKFSNRNIHNVLKLSFSDLDSTEMNIFLDIACFYSRIHEIVLDERYFIKNRNILTVLLDACNFFGTLGIEVLLNKALITSSYGTIEMHDLLVETGKEIVKQNSPLFPEERSRLWDSDEVYEVLRHNKGTRAVEVIFFDVSKFEDIHLSSDAFKNMTNLRCLHIRNHSMEYNVHFPKGLACLSDKLRYLSWYKFPLESLPSTFCAESLVRLHMRFSKLKRLWNGIQKLDNLRIIELNYSYDLIEIPDLSRAPKLEMLSLCYCKNLLKLHPSIFTAPKLKHLNLSGCKKIERLKFELPLKSLQTLYLYNCSSLVEFSVISEEMTDLSLDDTAIRELPSSIWCNSKLSSLSLTDCKKLDIVVRNISDDPVLRSLTIVDLSGCTQINTLSLSFILDGMRSLEQLDLSECCNLETIPDNIQNNLKLKDLDLDECRKLKSIPKLPESLDILTALNCAYVDTYSSIQQKMLENILPNFSHDSSSIFSFLPGSQIPCVFDFQTTKPSIDIHVPIQTIGWNAFIYCIILSKGLIADERHEFMCSIYEQGKEVDLFKFLDIHSEWTLISDHVILGIEYDFDEFKIENGGDHCNLSFEFKYRVDDKWSTEGIKGCGVIPIIYKEYDESDVFEESDNKFDEVEVRSSNDENEDDQQQLFFPTKRKRTSSSNDGNEDDQQLFLAKTKRTSSSNNDSEDC